MSALARYAAKFKDGKDTKIILSRLQELVFHPPADPPFPISMTDKRVWEKEVDIYVDRKRNYEDNKMNLYAVAYGQCSKAMKAKLKTLQNFQNINDGHDLLGLLRAIKSIGEQLDTRDYFPKALVNIKLSFFNIRQGDKESNADYQSRFIKYIEVADSFRISLFDDQALIKYELVQVGVIRNLQDTPQPEQFHTSGCPVSR